MIELVGCCHKRGKQAQYAEKHQSSGYRAVEGEYEDRLDTLVFHQRPV